MLAQALAHYCEAKLLLLDVTDFSVKVSCTHEVVHFSCFFFSVVSPFAYFLQIQSKYGSSKKNMVRFLSSNNMPAFKIYYLVYNN